MSLNESIYSNPQNMVQPANILQSTSANYGKFVCGPLESGFGITIGNALRRILLSSLYGCAIVAIKFDRIMHEFTVLPGVLEDVTELILNMKQVRLRLHHDTPELLTLRVSGSREVRAGDIVSPDGSCEILNPDLYIATLTSEDAVLNMEITVRTDKGYSLSEYNYDQNAAVGAIPVDAIFSPIERVVYNVGTATHNGVDNYDKLNLEVWTDGSISPEDAVSVAAKIFKEQLKLFIDFEEYLVQTPEEVHTDESDQRPSNEHLMRSVEELELSVRSANCLKNANIHKIYQLVSKTEAEMLKTKNFGRKSLNEIKEVLSDMDLSLGMKIDGFPLDEDTSPDPQEEEILP